MDAASLGGGPSSADHDARSRAAVRSLLEGLPDATVCCSRDGVIVLANELAARLFGRPRHELVGRPVHTLWPARMRERYARGMERCFAGARPIRVTERALGMRRDGSEFVGEMSWGVVELDGEPVLVAIGRDLTPHLDGEARLLRRSRQQEVVAELGARALRGADPGELARLAAAQAGEALAADAVEVRLPPPAPGAPPPVVASWGRGDGDALPGASVPIAADARVHGVLVARRAAVLGSDDRAFLQAVGNVLATAAARRDADERIRHQALHDDLTGLANRVLCRDRLEQAAARAARTGTTAAVLAVDIDGFKTVNDRCGHAAGDAVLVALAGRLASAVRPADTVARMGGDEFLVVCEDVDERTALALAHRVAEAVRRPLEVDGRRHELSASVGVAVSSPERPAADALVAAADAAAYRAKAGGPGRVELYDERLRRRVEERLRVESQLAGAVGRAELSLVFQPVVALDGGATAGHEALLRWRRPAGRPVGASEAVAVAEESGLIVEIGGWVLREACRLAARLGGPPGAWVSVNVGARQVADPALAHHVDEALAAAGLPAARLRLELAETALPHLSGDALANLAELRSRGVGIALDGFGTGSCSPARLRRLPVDMVKVDRSLVAGIAAGGGDRDDAAIVAAIVGLGAALGIAVVAEGVEDAAQVRRLRELGCPLAQGFHLGAPAPAPAG